MMLCVCNCDLFSSRAQQMRGRRAAGSGASRPAVLPWPPGQAAGAWGLRGAAAASCALASPAVCGKQRNLPRYVARPPLLSAACCAGAGAGAACKLNGFSEHYIKPTRTPEPSQSVQARRAAMSVLAASGSSWDWASSSWDSGSSRRARSRAALLDIQQHAASKPAPPWQEQQHCAVSPWPTVLGKSMVHIYSSCPSASCVGRLDGPLAERRPGRPARRRHAH